ncbi:unnamed protein product [Gongylonema pulchrum]|uniref:HELP domain-containing protein n=1 Tax=Gongylonema pulchrum TaxID=637853 RepID=A0A183E881_9BILA|nr:unnamed protein product [Gongylonema pulchrum]
MNENLNKTEILQESAVLPQTRFRDINRNLQALDLDNSRRFNPFMAAFGVRVSSTPLTVEGHRRGAPQVIYSDAGGRGGIINIDSRNANWRMTGKEYLIVAQLSCWFILYDEQKDEKMVL